MAETRKYVRCPEGTSKYCLPTTCNNGLTRRTDGTCPRRPSTKPRKPRDYKPRGCRYGPRKPSGRCPSKCKSGDGYRDALGRCPSHKEFKKYSNNTDNDSSGDSDEEAPLSPPYESPRSPYRSPNSPYESPKSPYRSPNPPRSPYKSRLRSWKKN